MPRVELACQEFGRKEGHEGKTSWPLDLSPSQVTDLLKIPEVFTLNTRRGDQLEGVDIWAVRNLLMLITILRSWERRRCWVRLLLECFATDPQLRRQWELRTIMDAEPIQIPDEVLLTEETEAVDFVLLPGMVPCRDLHRALRLAEIDGQRAARHAESQYSLSFNEGEIDLLISNIGQEDYLL